MRVGAALLNGCYKREDRKGEVRDLSLNSFEAGTRYELREKTSQEAGN
jgi:hypothetical protein